jgi:hypothetical protein
LKIIYTREEIEGDGPFIFLAGPTPRSPDVKSWRPEAIRIFEDLGFGGTLLIPENRDETKSEWDYLAQIKWEDNGLNTADCIMFWIPRNMKTMPALTTNIEWGRWERSGKVVLGFPGNNTPHIRYIWHYADKLHIPYSYWLEETVKLAIKKANGRRDKSGL